MALPLEKGSDRRLLDQPGLLDLVGRVFRGSCMGPDQSLAALGGSEYPELDPRRFRGCAMD